MSNETLLNGNCGADCIRAVDVFRRKEFSLGAYWPTKAEWVAAAPHLAQAGQRGIRLNIDGRSSSTRALSWGQVTCSRHRPSTA